MKQFLKHVAETYVSRELTSLHDYCFVFPNKRSSLFFRKYLVDAINEYKGNEDDGIPVIHPDITTIDQFMKSLVDDLIEATRYEQLFNLYREYKKLSPGALEFDRFRFWGDMLLGDFNDVDRYMVDTHALFINLQRLREINSTYLTPEQRELIKEYWGEERPDSAIDAFWTHVTHDNEYSDGQNDNEEKSLFNEKFLKLWEILDPLYESFNASLAEMGLATPGHIYRKAVENLKTLRDDLLVSDRYIFVGFNILSTSELAIFEMLKDMGRADFYWDINSPALRDNNNKATRIILGNARKFRSRYPLNEPKIEKLNRVDIVGIPSKTGQAKYAAKIIEEMINDGRITATNNAMNTAVILPDESLMVPLIHAIPEEIVKMNVTMGYPIKQTPVASLLRRIISMHLRASKSRDDFRYFYQDVLAIASHPLLQNVSKEDCRRLNDEINSRRLYTLTGQEIKKICPDLSAIFASVEDVRDFEEVCRYVENLISFLRTAFENNEGNGNGTLNYLDAYSDALNSLREAVDRFGITMEESTVFHLLESAISSDTVNFKGEPLQGLQIMGVLETRALDFDNVIMLSMNERIFPRRHTSGSFIPEALRRGHGMSTTEAREGVFAYYFFRLLSRAKSVTLLYDSRTVGGKSNEKSRYLTQLLYLFNDGTNVTHRAATYRGVSFDDDGISITKTPEIMQRLNLLREEGSGKSLSPSSINNYINCPLQFYLTVVEGLYQQDEINDYMDFSTYGTIVHSVVERLYTNLRPDPSIATPVEVTAETIDGFLNATAYLRKLITITVNEIYNKLGKDNLTELEGDSYAIGKMMLFYITEMLKEEKKFTPFVFIGAEKRSVLRLPIDDDITINYTQVIDRLDRIDNGSLLRIVDYKTGGDKSNISTIDMMFDSEDENRPKAILQLFLYCNAYAHETGYQGPIQPILYNLRFIGTKGIIPVTVSKSEGKGSTPILDYREYNDEFKDGLSRVIHEIFDPEVPFRQAHKDKACKFCNFKSLCGRQ